MEDQQRGDQADANSGGFLFRQMAPGLKLVCQGQSLVRVGGIAPCHGVGQGGDEPQAQLITIDVFDL